MDAIISNFQKKLDRMANKTLHMLQHACDSLDLRITKCSQNIKTCILQSTAQMKRDLMTAERVVTQELKNKLLMAGWCNAFIAEGKTEQLNPISFAYGRFALNIAAAYNEVPFESLLQANLPSFLISLLASPLDTVVGPALLALYNVSLINDEMKHVIVSEGALPKLLKVTTSFTSLSILTQCSKICASLALHYPNKPQIASSGLFHALIDLTIGEHCRVDDSTRLFSLQALANLTFGNEANRNILVELRGIPPLLDCICCSNQQEILVAASQVVANVAYRSAHTTAALLRAHIDQALLEALSITDLITSPATVRVCILALTNLCNAPRFRAHLGPYVVKTSLHICKHATYFYRNYSIFPCHTL